MNMSDSLIKKKRSNKGHIQKEIINYIFNVQNVIRQNSH